MAREKFEDRRLKGKVSVACKFDDGTVRYWDDLKENIVYHIKLIITEYSNQGYVLSLRQLHYQFVSQNWIVNHDTAYKKLGNILDDCRYAGIIDWDAIEDRGRTPYLPYWVTDVDHAIRDTIAQYRIDRQDGQPNYVELWTEKDALSGIFRRTTSKYHIQLVVNKGYTSSSAAYAAYQRVSDRILKGQKVTILYFGDHDPSGLDMIRDVRDRLTLFLSKGDQLWIGEFYDKVSEWWDKTGYYVYDLVQNGYADKRVLKALADVEPDNIDELYRQMKAATIQWYLEENEVFQVRPIGLTKEQVRKYDLPPNPTKTTDSRYQKYVKLHGKDCWEVDALKPEVLTEIVETNIRGLIDIEMYNNQVLLEKQGISELKEMLKR